MKLILHSDDFGLHPSVDEAIKDTAAAGMLTSASLMANGLSADTAIESVKNGLNIGVGVHLNIYRGRPMSDPAKIPSIVDGQGRFFSSATKLAGKSLTGQLSEAEIFHEYCTQVEYILDHGITPTHFDGEKHTHLAIPEAAAAVRRLADKYGIHKVRRIRESPVVDMLKARGIDVTGTLTQQLKLKLLEWRSLRVGKIWNGLVSTPLFFGVTISGKIDMDHTLGIFEEVLKMGGGKTVEWMFHLGYPVDKADDSISREFGRFFLDEAKDKETNFLLSAEVQGLIRRYSPELISYAQL